MAYLVASLIDDGVKPEELRVEWVDTLRRVACGQTLPEVMATFRSSLVERIGALPLPDQQSIIDARPLKLAIRTENGWDHRLVAFINATPKERDQLLDTKRHHLRTEAEQRVWLDGKRRRGTRDGAAVRAGVLEVDKDRDGAYCGKKFIPKADLRAALRILGG
jgi:hypothetical protein